MNVKPNTKTSSDTAKQIPFAIVPSTLTSHRGITASMKVVLTYLLEKYQTKRADGRPWDFSNASIEDGTGLPRRTVYNITEDLIKSKVLKHYGQITRKTRPTILYLFAPEMLETYLKKDNAKSEIVILDNANAVETNIEGIPNNRDNAKDNAKDNATIAYHKEDLQKEDLQKEEIKESTSTNSGKTFSKPTLNENLADLFDKECSAVGLPSMDSETSSTNSREEPATAVLPNTSMVSDVPVLASSVPSALAGKENKAFPSVQCSPTTFRGLTTCPIPLYGR